MIHKEKNMNTEPKPILTQQEDRQMNFKYQGGSSETVYGLGLIGAWVYYFKRATTNQQRVQAFFKGLFWPAFLVHDLFVYLEKK
jgi:hypothetical protein